MNLYSIASGSSGNCIYVGNETCGLLVDAGISKKRIVEALSAIGVKPESLLGIFITHEHSDHISGLCVFLKQYNIPVFATRETVAYMQGHKSLKEIKEISYRVIEPNTSFWIQDILVHPFSISHDACNPVSYTFTCGQNKIGVATDLGRYDETILSCLKDCDALLIEANHDINMLETGPYPYSLKLRVLGDRGHLSNDRAGRLLNQMYTEKLKYIVLGHLSKENNYPLLAYETVKYELELNPLVKESSYKLWVANRDTPSELISI